MFASKRWLFVTVAVLSAVPVRGADLSKYLPEDTEVVIGIDFAALKQAAVVQKHLPALVKRFGPELVKMGAESGGQKLDADVLKALTRILADGDAVRAWLNKGRFRRYVIGTNADLDSASLCLICEGDFGGDYVKETFAFVVKNRPFGIAARTVKEGSHDLLGIKLPGDDEEYFVAPADESTIVCCTDRAAVVRALGRKTRDMPGVRRELIAVAGRVDPKAVLWMAAAPKETDEYVDAHASVIVADGIRLSASVTAKDADAARTLASDVAGTFKDFAEDLDDAVKQLPPLGMLRDALKKVDPKAEKSVVTIDAELSAAAIDTLIKELTSTR